MGRIWWDSRAIRRRCSADSWTFQKEEVQTGCKDQVLRADNRETVFQLRGYRTLA